MFVSRTLQVIYLLLAASCSKGTILDEDIVHLEDQSHGCTLPCLVNSRNTAKLPPPRVSWFHESYKDVFLPLNDTKGWDTDYKQQICTMSYVEHKQFTRPSHFHCIKISSGDEETTSYDCSQILDKCYYGEFRCRVEFADGVLVEKNVSVEIPSELSGKLLSDSTATQDAQIELTWTASNKRELNTEDCKWRNCHGSRRYHVRMLVYTSLPLMEPEYKSDWLAARKKQTKHIFSYPQSAMGKYFQFEVRNERKDFTLAQHSSIDKVQVKTSGVFYFGQQENARLTEPLQDMVHDASHFQYLRISCSGAGTPTPNITLSEEKDGKLTTVDQSVGGTVGSFLIVNRPFKLHCSASNYVVSASGEIQHITHHHTITINYNPEN